MSKCSRLQDLEVEVAVLDLVLSEVLRARGRRATVRHKAAAAAADDRRASDEEEGMAGSSGLRARLISVCHGAGAAGAVRSAW